MNIIPNQPHDLVHPVWCATPFCDLSISTDPIHRMWPQAWALAGTDVEISVAAQREDERQSDGTYSTNRVGVGLEILDVACLTIHGDPVQVRTSLPPDEARRLADALNAQADLADAIARGEAQ